MKQRGLGMGLLSLLHEDLLPLQRPAGSDIIEMIDIDMIEAGPYQPRKKFETSKIKELADSIISSGLLQPIIVTPINDKNCKYKIIAGERRWRASKLAGMNKMQVIVKDFNNQEILKVALLENIQREELSTLEEAEGMQQLMQEFNFTQEQLCQKLGKSRSHVANILRLNQLPLLVKEKLSDGIISMGHARCLIGQTDYEIILDYIISNDLNVRQTEALIKERSESKNPKVLTNSIKLNRKKRETTDIDLLSISESLSENLKTKILIEEFISSEGGRIIINYENPQQLDQILSKLS